MIRLKSRYLIHCDECDTDYGDGLVEYEFTNKGDAFLFAIKNGCKIYKGRVICHYCIEQSKKENKQ